MNDSEEMSSKPNGCRPHDRDVRVNVNCHRNHLVYCIFRLIPQSGFRGLGLGLGLDVERIKVGIRAFRIWVLFRVASFVMPLFSLRFQNMKYKSLKIPNAVDMNSIHKKMSQF